MSAACSTNVNYAHLATVLPDGAPHSVPLWVGLEGDRIAFLASPDSRKARNLEADPRMALWITEHATPYVMALVRGRVVERVEGDRAWKIIDWLSDRYLGQPYPLRTDRVVFLAEADHAPSDQLRMTFDGLGNCGDDPASPRRYGRRRAVCPLKSNVPTRGGARTG
jgi:PPOX class probable F420-dependent enzyme